MGSSKSIEPTCGSSGGTSGGTSSCSVSVCFCFLDDEALDFALALDFAFALDVAGALALAFALAFDPGLAFAFCLAPPLLFGAALGAGQFSSESVSSVIGANIISESAMERKLWLVDQAYKYCCLLAGVKTCVQFEGSMDPSCWWKILSLEHTHRICYLTITIDHKNQDSKANITKEITPPLV